MFKLKKYKEGYENEKRGVSLRYSLEIRSFIMCEGQDPPESSAAPAAVMETSLNAPSSDVVPLTSSTLLTASDARQVAGTSPATVEETSLNTPSSDATPLATNSPPAALDTGRVAWATSEEATLSASGFEASHRGKGKVSV